MMMRRARCRGLGGYGVTPPVYKVDVHIKNRFGVNGSKYNIAILLEKLLSVHTIKRSQIQVLTYTFD